MKKITSEVWVEKLIRKFGDLPRCPEERNMRGMILG